MPYIKQEERDAPSVETPGHLNYLISKSCHMYLERHGVTYTNLNAVIGVLECAKQELYSEIVRSYEKKKKEENGSVSELDK